MESGLDCGVLDAAVDLVQSTFGVEKVDWGLILGSGWADVLKVFTVKQSLPYQEIPGLGTPEVAGHAGLLHLAEYEQKTLLIFQGRRHWYEGQGWTPIALPIYLLKQMQAKNLLLTNAAGGLGYGFKAGDLMIVEDHINLMGSQILGGRLSTVWGERFPDMSKVYDPRLSAALAQAGAKVGEELRRGVFCALAGPQYETPAEIRMLRAVGVQAVGMSLVPEATVAHAAGIKVVGLSCITNLAAGISPSPLSHHEVQEIGRSVAPRAQRLLTRFFAIV